MGNILTGWAMQHPLSLVREGDVQTYRTESVSMAPEMFHIWPFPVWKGDISSGASSWFVCYLVPQLRGPYERCTVTPPMVPHSLILACLLYRQSHIQTALCPVWIGSPRLTASIQWAQQFLLSYHCNELTSSPKLITCGSQDMLATVRSFNNTCVLTKIA
jgi:hypothetical protein